MKVAFIGNQGGRQVLSFYAGMARALNNEFGVRSHFSVWIDGERDIPSELGMCNSQISSFESYVKSTPVAGSADVDRLLREYREVNWSEVVAVERAFTDYSMLLGAAGDRRESNIYVQQLVVALVRYFEGIVVDSDAVICQTADTLLSLIAVKVAQHHAVPVFAIRPATLLEPGTEGGFFGNSEFLECRRMMKAFSAREGLTLSPFELTRVASLIKVIRGVVGLTSFHANTSKGKSSGRKAITPNLKRILPYLRENAMLDKNIHYTKFDPLRKVSANILRAVRKRMTRGVYGPISVDEIPRNSVFYALHFQPEQTTLAQGIWYANQVALVENLSKSMPLGFTLVVKEHPWGRGNRPAWQYKHMAGLYNVMFCDAPAKQIIQRVDAVIAVTGTVAMEALIFDKPAVVLGRTFFDFSDLLYLVRNVQDLPEVLAKILVDSDYKNQTNREERLHRFLISYLDGLIPYFPLPQNSEQWGRALASELGISPVSLENKSEKDKR
ncbi:MAG: hypothetical protein HYX42_06615 [Polaromonas sp.]|uniref:capsular polysaccharide export protein, LipB/KpsS family n=1 Tax=Polaromonas sp. TaxID=1869339 RepID=UPI0025E79307|nr:hypothetical protein [Polaromonas sp.]MBI2725905.1 hypothetical protein [Polaromonas sp.]